MIVSLSKFDAANYGKISDHGTVVHINWQVLSQGTVVHAIHEFGHALGFQHEWMRTDWPGDRCGDPAQEGTHLTWFADADSIMEYCTGWDVEGLSAGDIIGLRNAYGGKPKRSLVGYRGMCADIEDGSTANGAKVIAYPCRGKWNDTFKRKGDLQLQTNTNNSSKKRCLNVAGAVGPNNVIAWDCVDTDNMQFSLKRQSWRAMGNLCVEAIEVGQYQYKLGVRECTQGWRQRWDFAGSGGDRIDQIRLSNTSLCVTTTTANGAMGQQLMLAQCSSSDKKQRFNRPGQGRIRMKENSNLCLNVSGGLPGDSDVVLWNGCDSTPPYNSVFTTRGEVKVGNYCLQSNGIGQQLVMRSCDGEVDQEWEYHL